MRRGIFRFRSISFATVLPLLVLAIWVALVLTPQVLLFLQAHEGSIGPKESVTLGYNFDVRRDDLLAIPLTKIMVSRARTIGTISLPATLVETLIAAPSVRASSWHPADFVLDTWRALAYPLYCLPAWWFIGKGVDAFFRKRHIRWPAMLAGTVLMLLFTLFFMDLRYGFNGQDSKGDLHWILLALGLWILMLAVFPAVWLKELLRTRFAEND